MAMDQGEVQEEAAEAQAAPAEDPIQLVQKGGEILSKLAQLLDSSPGITDEDKAQMSQIMDLYVDLAERKLGGGQPEKAGPSGPVPMNQGQTGQPMGPNARQ